jgi:hypothetical protein
MYWLFWPQVTALPQQQNLSLQNNPETDLHLGIQLWGTASTSNIEILERFQ